MQAAENAISRTKACSRQKYYLASAQDDRTYQGAFSFLPVPSTV
jgi:hypothetical protein